MRLVLSALSHPLTVIVALVFVFTTVFLSMRLD